MSSDPNYQWEDLLDIDDSDLPLTSVLRPCNRHVRETITITLIQNTDGIFQVEEVEKNPIRIIPGLAEYMKQVVEDVGEDEDFNNGLWVSATEYVKANGGIVSGCLGDIKTFLKNRKLEQVVAIIKLCSPNALGDLKVTVKDLFGTLAGLIHYKVINERGYEKEITVESAIIVANVSVFSPTHQCIILTLQKNMVKVFHKDFIPGNGNGVGGSAMLMEKEEIVKLVEEEEMADLELHVCRNMIDQEDLYKFDEEALDLVLEEEAMESKAHEEWLEKCRQQEEENAEHKRQLLGFHGII
nr:hypothetical protein [Tanacetum cinerariifolium]